MPNILQIAPSRALDLNGFSVPGALASFHNSGTTTPRTVYSDADCTVPHASPVVANGAGVFPAIYDSGAGDVKVTVTDADGVTLAGYPIDPAPVVSTDATGASAVSFEPTAAIPETNVQAAVERVNSNAVAPLAGFGLGVTGNSTAITDLDSISIGSGAYRFTDATAGTFPAGVTADTGGTVRIWRETASSAVMMLVAAGSTRTHVRTLNDGSWGAWAYAVQSSDTASNTEWSTGTSTSLRAASPANVRTAIKGAMNVSGDAPMFAARAWARIAGTGSNGPATFNGGNIRNAARLAQGYYSIAFDVDMPIANYAVVIGTSNKQTCEVADQTISGFRIQFRTTTGGEAAEDPFEGYFMVVC